MSEIEFFFVRIESDEGKKEKGIYEKNIGGKIANGEVADDDDDETQVLTMALLNLFTMC